MYLPTHSRMCHWLGVLVTPRAHRVLTDYGTLHTTYASSLLNMIAPASAFGVPVDFEWTAGTQPTLLGYLDWFRIYIEFADYDILLDEIATTDIVQYAIRLVIST